MGFGKSYFPSNVSKSTSLSELITKESSFFFISCKLTLVSCLKILQVGEALLHTEVV